MVRARQIISVGSNVRRSASRAGQRILRTAVMSAIAGTSLTAATAQATTFYSTWIAPGSGSWGDPANWSGNRYPGNYFIPPPPLGGEPQTGEFFVTVNATGGPAYTITEPNLIGVSDFHLASPT